MFQECYTRVLKGHIALARLIFPPVKGFYKTFVVLIIVSCWIIETQKCDRNCSLQLTMMMFSVVTWLCRWTSCEYIIHRFCPLSNLVFSKISAILGQNVEGHFDLLCLMISQVWFISNSKTSSFTSKIKLVFGASVCLLIFGTGEFRHSRFGKLINYHKY